MLIRKAQISLSLILFDNFGWNILRLLLNSSKPTTWLVYKMCLLYNTSIMQYSFSNENSITSEEDLTPHLWSFKVNKKC